MTRVTVGHSPDADDAYMFYALAHGKVTVEGLDPGGYAEVHADIQALNRRALAGDLDMSQVSAGAYPYVADQYRITACGASMGLNYGPIVVARDAETDVRDARVAIPGQHTTAYLLGRIFLPAFEPVEMAFADVLPAVRDGSVAAGIVIHEGQLNYADYGVVKQVDLGERWFASTGLPLAARDQRGAAGAVRVTAAGAGGGLERIHCLGRCASRAGVGVRANLCAGGRRGPHRGIHAHVRQRL